MRKEVSDLAVTSDTAIPQHCEVEGQLLTPPWMLNVAAVTAVSEGHCVLPDTGSHTEHYTLVRDLRHG